ncbi:KxYKxGKxW signal peptide domain-containing protein [Secundilactobacillus yichangensis]|uniref:KxYKxGKxW signal peptide domain-containing protein n=1 Tax=Secundilactobacillus yichangensis TaxID=2799580 RepID=UPI0019435D0E|nr:KxYKxGKxW signal peptide domain-containing protein [Secundilactobacillus yichangensis]
MLHNQGLHYKMYKAKKHWLFAGMGVILTSSALLMGGSVVAHADETSTTAVADVPADTPTDGGATGEPTAQVQNDGTGSTSTTVTPEEAAKAQEALNNYNNYKNNGYTQAVNQFESQKTTLDSQKENYNSQKEDYENQLSNYNNQVNEQASGYQTSNPEAESQLNDAYGSVYDKYNDLENQQNSINNQVDDANTDVKNAENQLAKLHDALPAGVLSAEEKVNQHNNNAKANAAIMVANAIKQAYGQALTSDPSGLTTMINDVENLKDNSPVKVLANSATPFGESTEYKDKNTDGKITFEDDILPVAIEHLKSDLTKVQNNQTNFEGSYTDVIALFNYLKQVGDTSLPTQTADGSEGRTESGLADTASQSLNNHGDSTSTGKISSAYGADLLSTIEGTKAQLESDIKDIYAGTGVQFPQTKFDNDFAKALKEQAGLIYKQQTDELLSTGQTLLAAFKNAEQDSIWMTPTADIYYSTKDLSQRLSDTLATIQQQVTAGATALANLPASDDFLSIAYTKGADGFTQTIDSLWNTLYSAVDNYGMSLSPLMKTVMPKEAQSDPGTKTETIQNPLDISKTITNTTYSPEFVTEHQAIFNAATALSTAVTSLIQQSAEVTNSFQDVLAKLSHIPGDFDTTLPDSVAYITPVLDHITAPQQVTLSPANILVQLNYVDDDLGGANVNYGNQTLSGYNGDQVTWTAQVPNNYQLAKNQAGSGTLTIGDFKDAVPVAVVTIHLTHQHVTSKVTQTVTTQFVPGTDDVVDSKLPADDVQTVTWTVDHDLVTGDWTATPNKTLLNPVKAPVIPVADGYYAPDILTYAGVALATKTGTDYPASEFASENTKHTRTITYYKEKAEVGPGIAVGTKEEVPDTAPSTTPTNPPTTGGGETGDPTVVENGGGNPTVVVPDGGNGSQPAPADDNSTTTDAGGDTSTTGPDSQTTETGRSASEGQATGNSQSVSDGSAVQNNNSGVTTAQANSQQGNAAQGQLPQTNETDENAAAGLGVLGLSLLMSALGLKKRKRD